MKRKGVFLIVALWFFLLLSVFCLGLGFRTYLEVRKTKLVLNKTRAFYLAVSGVKTAKDVLNTDKDKSSIDSLQEAWAKPVVQEFEFASPHKKGVLKIDIQDESARLNVNTIDKAVFDDFKKILEFHGIDDAEKKIYRLWDYIDADFDPRISESFDSETEVKNSFLSVPGELFLVKSFTNEEYKRIENMITIFGTDSRININTVSKQLLDVFLDDGILKGEVLSRRFGPNGIEGDEDDGFYESVPAGLQARFKTDSDFFRVTSEAAVDGVQKKICCVINRNSGKILYWYEQ